MATRNTTCDAIGILPKRRPAIRGQGPAARRQRTNAGRCQVHGIHLHTAVISSELVTLVCARGDCAYTIDYPRAWASAECVEGRGHTINIKEAC